jgi:uncharacterized protein (TIGR03067 family)
MSAPLFLAVLALGIVPAPQDDKAKELDGVWVVESARRGGEAFDRIVGDRLTITNGTLTIKSQQEDREQVAKITVDPKTDPKSIDVQPQDGPDADRKVLAIYKVEGDTLTLCFGMPMNMERPKNFESTADNMNSVVVLKRVKDQDNN